MELIDIDIGEDERETIIEKYKKLIREPYDYLGNMPGKKMREKLTNIINYWTKLTAGDMDIIMSIVDKLHNLSLLLDDIQDNSCIRRGAPAAHIVYGTARTFSSVIYMYNNTMLEKVPHHHRESIGNWVFITSTRALKGQIMDTYWRDKFICPSEEAYIDMVCKKTGTFLELLFVIAEVLRGGTLDKDFTKFSKLIAAHFQILDDYCNLTSEAYFEKKGFCDDLTEGKFSYPIICALHNHPEDRRILEILKMHTNDDTIKRECLALIEKYGGFEDTRNKLSSLREEISDEIDKLEGQPIKDEIMELLFIQLQ